MTDKPLLEVCPPIDDQSPQDPARRDFLTLTAGAVGAVGVCAAVWPFLNSMNPAADVLALASLDIDLKDIPEGQTKIILWRGKPVFIRHRTPAEIEEANHTPLKSLADPQTDQERFSKNAQWLVVIGVCTHLGCVPNGQKEGGWLCPCHGSIYDTSGRVVRGPAPKNLEIPPYGFINEGKTLRIG